MPKSALDVDLDMVVGTRRFPSESQEITAHGVCLLLCIAHLFCKLRLWIE
ncbi:hypothetical protein J4G08_14495 [Candidatus Poribacteria bacterium]|nr:hypothetical protein [Candidatus Poribacteria bacterium]